MRLVIPEARIRGENCQRYIGRIRCDVHRASRENVGKSAFSDILTFGAAEFSPFLSLVTDAPRHV